MCAINGVTCEDRALVERMNRETTHRGPDATSVWEGEGVTLGHNRLSIIDLTNESLQPFHSYDGRYTLVFNGEIYNYKQLRDELVKYPFQTKGDTEVLLAAYVTWGKDMLQKLNGIFAFAVWDSHKKLLFMARDPMGVKPLYYSFKGGVLAFSSELPPLLSRTTNAISKDGLAHYLGMEYVPSPETIASEVSKLAPSHTLTYENKTVVVEKYFTAYHKVAGNVRNIYETIDAAVQRELVSERQVGAYLSGGIDSSIVVHHMRKYLSEVRTYSVDFEPVTGEESDTGKFNRDAELAARTAKEFGTKHATVTIGIEEVRDSIEKILASMSEPIANATLISQYLLSEYVRKDGTVVVLGGDGGDELFGGYTRHKVAMAAYLYQRMPAFLQNIGSLRSGRVGKLRTPFGTQLHKALMVKGEDAIQPLLRVPSDLAKTTNAFFDAHYEKYMRENAHPLNTFMQVDRETWLPDECLIRSDFASMAHGIELRVPLLDPQVVSLSDTISVWKKTLPYEGKRILRKTYKEYLPSYLFSEPKRGWISPGAKWLRDPVIHSFVCEVFSSGYYDGLSTLFDWNAIQKLLSDHVEKRGYHLYPLWNILALQVWARAHRVSFM